MQYYLDRMITHMNYKDNSTEEILVDRQQLSEAMIKNIWVHKDTKVSDSDMVNSPQHYKSDGIECIEAIQAALTPEEFRGFLKGNAFKYLWREGKKNNALEDVQKSNWYISKLEEVTK